MPQFNLRPQSHPGDTTSEKAKNTLTELMTPAQIEEAVNPSGEAVYCDISD